MKLIYNLQFTIYKKIKKYCSTEARTIGSKTSHFVRRVSEKLKLKIENSWQSQFGFTLIEMLAVIAIFATVGIIITSILITSLRTSNKANVVNSVRSNGDFALNQISQSLRDARYISSPFPCITPVTTSSISFTAADGGNLTYSCSGTTIASNGASILDSSVTVVSNACSFTCTQNNINDNPLINIQFSLNPSNAGNFNETQASQSAVPFNTTVQMRNLSL